MRSAIPAEIRVSIDPLFDVLESIGRQIKQFDREIARSTKEEFPEANLLTQVHGIGPITALAYVATIEDPARFKKSRDVGAYIGLVPKSRSSSLRDPDLRITKRGDAMLRRLLVSCATRIIGPYGKDSDLKRLGDRIQERGGQAVRAKARIAVARKLAVLLHRLWTTTEQYEPLRNSRSNAA
jgi:transposase